MNREAAIPVEELVEELSPRRRFRLYAEYRNSTNDWLDGIPAHWTEKPLKHLAALNTDKLADKTEPDFELEYVDIGNVNLVNGITSTETLRFDDAPSRARRLVRKGDTIVSTVRTYLKAIAFMADPPDNLVVSTGFAVLRPHSELDGRYLYRLVQSEPLVQRVVAHSVGVSYPGINPAELGRFRFPVPPLDEQRAIAAFLDRETARIDALIAKKERLIELLQEKRTALISHAVTKGLDPTRPIKPSGVSWIPNLPTHWSIRPLKFFSNLKPRSFIDGDWIETPYVTFEGIRLIQCGNIGTGVYEEQGFRCISEETFRELRCTAVHPGDVLICRMRSSPQILAGRACQAPSLGEKMVTAVDNCILKCAHNVDARFLVYQLSSRAYLEYIEATARGGTRDRISRSMLGAIRLVCPPLDEQRCIADYLDQHCSRINALASQMNHAIDRLREYRSALISAAVTGKIDVRKEVN